VKLQISIQDHFNGLSPELAILIFIEISQNVKVLIIQKFE